MGLFRFKKKKDDTLQVTIHFSIGNSYPISSFKIRMDQYCIEYNVEPITPYSTTFNFSFHKQFKKLVDLAHRDVFKYPLYDDIEEPLDPLVVTRMIKINKIKKKITIK